MRGALSILVLLLAAFCGYWFIGAHLFRQGVEDWFAAQQAAGRDAEVQGLEVGGFPATFAASSGALMIRDPSGWGWQVPEVAVSMPSWWPFRVTAHLPDRQVLDTPRGQVEIASEGLTGRFGLSPTLDPVRLHVESGPMEAVAAEGTVVASSVRFDSVRNDAMTHHATLHVEGLSLDAGPLALDGGRVQVDADVTLAEPLDDLPDAVAVPVDGIVLRKAEMIFDDITLTATGDILADARGFAAGEVNVQLRNWPEALDAAVAAGLIPEDRVAMLEGGFRMMAQDDTLTLPLTLSGGQVRFGPLPLGPAPRLK